MKIRLLLNLFISAILIIATAEYDDGRLGLVETLEKQNYDWRLNRDINIGKKQEDIVIVDIDQDSFRELGDWPWSRDVYADLISKLFGDLGARVVAFTIPYPEPNDAELRILDKVQRAIQEGDQSPQTSGADVFGDNQFSVNSQLQRLREEFNYDKHFADAIHNNAVVLGYRFIDVGRVQGDLPAATKFIGTSGQAVASSVLKSATRDWPFRRGFSGNLSILMDASNKVAGHVMLSSDNDGVIRRLPLFVKHAGSYYESLPLAVIRKYARYGDAEPLAVDTDSLWSPLGIKYTLPDINVGPLSVPFNLDGHIYLRYGNIGGRSADFRTNNRAVFRYIPVFEILMDRLSRNELSGKIVLIGSSSSLLREVHATPVNSAMPMVELMATALANMVDRDVLHRPGTAHLYEIMMMTAVLAVLSLLFVFVGPLFSFLLLLVVIIGQVLFVLNDWQSHNVVWAMTPMLLAVTGLFIVNVITGFVVEWRSSRQLRNTFSQYVPPEFAKRMGQGNNKINLEGELRELSVLFSDVRNFTAISEKLSPRELTLLMNRMLTALSEAIHRYNGTVDKYIGDAVMAFWNAPLEDVQHAQNAVLTALDMQKTIAELSDNMVSEGYREMKLGVGISTGETNVGNMGSALRMTYTAIGDTVNIASRIEGLTKFYQVPILVTETTRQQCDEQVVAFRIVDSVRVKGRETPLRIYEPVGLVHLLEPDSLRQIGQFEKMWEHYAKGEFQTALDILKDYRQTNADDKLADVYEKRLIILSANPTPDGWDGVFSHVVK